MPTNPAAAAYEVSSMTRSEVLTLVAQLRPHEYSESVMLRWLEELEKKMQRCAYERYLSHFTAEKMGEEVQSVYESLVEKRKSRS